MEQANPGDVVVLASGGPDMTVLAVRDLSGVQCAALGWFKDGEVRTTELPIKALVLRGDTGCKEPCAFASAFRAALDGTFDLLCGSAPPPAAASGAQSSTVFP